MEIVSSVVVTVHGSSFLSIELYFPSGRTVILFIVPESYGTTITDTDKER